MSLYKRGSVYWSTIMVDGVRHLRSLETSNRREAERREHVIKEELYAKRFQGAAFRPEMRFGELYARFLAEGDVKFHHRDRAKHFLPFFSEMSLRDISKNDMARYRKYRHEEHLVKQSGKHPKPLSDATINRDFSVIRHLLYWAVDEGFIPQNPLARLRMARERRQRRPVLSVAHEIKVLPLCGVAKSSASVGRMWTSSDNCSLSRTRKHLRVKHAKSRLPAGPSSFSRRIGNRPGLSSPTRALP